MASKNKTKEIVPISTLLNQKAIVERFNELLGDKAQSFISSVIEIVRGSYQLSKADPQTVINAAATAAILDLQINKAFGHAWIIPYEDWRTGTVVAQFQLGWKGYVQLALRSGLYTRINTATIYESQFKGFDALSEQLVVDMTQPEEGAIAGYAAYFELLSGFKKTVFWTTAQVKKHAEVYSKTYGKLGKDGKLVNSPWNNDYEFHKMAKKTVLIHAISNWGIMSIEMSTAYLADQSVQRTEGNYDYVDRAEKGKIIDITETEENKERARILDHIADAKTRDELFQVFDLITEYDVEDEYNEKWDQLPEQKKQ